MKIRSVLLLTLLFLGAIFAQTAAAGVMDGDVIRIGTEATYPPFEFRNEKNEIVGYEIDIALEIAEILGKKVEIVDMAFDGLIPALLTRKVDLLAAGMTNTEERRKKVGFSTVYYDIENAFVVRSDDDSMTGLDDLKGKIATVQM
ncbi:MAG: transporter substrate-binding domain-containing protein, partial [Synergistaceae bacterium]|nr:transporter substrate-binding domain-containing protein [Synergistaceae bacterium]